MCLTCHRAIQAKHRDNPLNGRLKFCQDGGGCADAWRQAKANNRPIPRKYQDVRIIQAYRRELMAAEVAMTAAFQRAGLRLLEVG